ncbi:hypothetical protein [Herbidospora daliensis]|uniref:hypothetical protein n=1 Tax=Herbidospora daliensis TaxID=295585 RepID=UPI0007861F64|nr:hypothetical protein [Herbidospora daliensis]
MTSSLSHVEDLCITYTTHSDIEVVASLIGAVPLTVDYRVAPEAMTQSTTTIVRWGDGILISHPYFGYECSRQEVLGALSNGGHLAVCVTWGLGCLPWSKSGGDMVPWFEAAAALAYFAYAVDGRLDAGFDPCEFDRTDPSVRCGWNPGAVDDYLHDLDFGSVTVDGIVGGRNPRPGRIILAQHPKACVTMLERISGASFPVDVQWPDSIEAGFTVVKPMRTMSTDEFARFMGPVSR